MNFLTKFKYLWVFFLDFFNKGELGSAFTGLMEPINPILHELHSLLPTSDALDISEEIVVPRVVCEYLKGLGSQFEEVIGRDKENQLRLTNYERLSNQSEHRLKMSEEKILRLEEELTKAQSTIAQLRNISSDS